MISRLRGRAVAWDGGGLVLDVGGVGYLLHATPSAVRKADGVDEVTIETHLHVREDTLQLFGFAEAAERELFEQLLAVSGVGPKVALAIVSGYSPAELRRAIVREDAALFQTIPGIGKKTAQRVVLELREKMTALVAVPEGGPVLGAGDGDLVARDALVELGYSVAEAEQRLAETDPDLPPAERVREALRAA
jgi:holliday junction DNA helicase RuvA